jgi:hypothetical protein
VITLMKMMLRVVGVLLMLMGKIWFLQGANVLTAGRSFMIGDPHWEYSGGVTVVVGLGLFVLSKRTKTPR